MTREDAIVLLNGIMKYCEQHWMFADLDDEEITQSYQDLDKFDSDVEIRYGLVEFLKDNRDCLDEDLKWSIDAVLTYMDENPIGNKILSDLCMKVEFAWENDLSDRTCKVSVGGFSVYVTFVCNRLPNDELTNAAAIANAIGWYQMYPTKEAYMEASGEEERCFIITESAYTNMRTILTPAELNKFSELAELF